MCVPSQSCYPTGNKEGSRIQSNKYSPHPLNKSFIVINLGPVMRGKIGVSFLVKGV